MSNARHGCPGARRPALSFSGIYAHAVVDIAREPRRSRRRAGTSGSPSRRRSVLTRGVPRRSAPPLPHRGPRCGHRLASLLGDGRGRGRRAARVAQRHRRDRPLGRRLVRADRRGRVRERCERRVLPRISAPDPCNDLDHHAGGSERRPVGRRPLVPRGAHRPVRAHAPLLPARPGATHRRADRVLPGELLLLGALQRVAVPPRVAARLLVGARPALGGGGDRRRVRGGDAQHRGSAGAGAPGGGVAPRPGGTRSAAGMGDGAAARTARVRRLLVGARRRPASPVPCAGGVAADVPSLPHHARTRAAARPGGDRRSPRHLLDRGSAAHRDPRHPPRWLGGVRSRPRTSSTQG